MWRGVWGVGCGVWGFGVGFAPMTQRPALASAEEVAGGAAPVHHQHSGMDRISPEFGAISRLAGANSPLPARKSEVESRRFGPTLRAGGKEVGSSRLSRGHFWLHVLRAAPPLRLGTTACWSLPGRWRAGSVREERLRGGGQGGEERFQCVEGVYLRAFKEGRGLLQGEAKMLDARNPNL